VPPLTRPLEDAKAFEVSQAAMAISLAEIRRESTFGASSRDDLKNYVNNFGGKQAQLIIGDQVSPCIFISGDQRSLLLSDPDQYVAPSAAPDGSDGVWLIMPPGGTSDIGLFIDATKKVIPKNVSIVQTSGHFEVGRGTALYVYDLAITPAFAAKPETQGWCFITKNGRGFRLLEEQHITFEAFGANGDWNINLLRYEQENVNPKEIVDVYNLFDNYPIWLRVRNFLDWMGRNRLDNASFIGVPRINFGRYSYRFSHYIELDNGTYGLHGYSALAGDQGGSGTRFNFDPGVKAGIVATCYNSNGLNEGGGGAGKRVRPYVAGGYLVQGSSCSHITDISLRSMGGTYGEGDGFFIKASVTIERCQSQHWGRDGFNIVADVQGSGNANCTTIRDCLSRFNGRAGIYTRGGDVNASFFINNNLASNGSCGFMECAFLGNHIYGMHTDGNGALPSAGPFWKGDNYFRVYCNLNGHYYRVAPDQENLASTTPPSGTIASNGVWMYSGDGVPRAVDAPTWTPGKKWQFTAPVLITGLNNRSTVTGIYAEGNQQPCYNNAQRSAVWTGGYSFWTGPGGVTSVNDGYIATPRFATNDNRALAFKATDNEFGIGDYRWVKDSEGNIISREGALDTFIASFITGYSTSSKFGRSTPVRSATVVRKLMLGSGSNDARQLGMMNGAGGLNGQEVAMGDFFLSTANDTSPNQPFGFKVLVGGVVGSTAVLQSLFSGKDPTKENLDVKIASNRAQLKRVGLLTVVNDVWYLNEDGRNGHFKLRSGTPPQSDIHEGLYIVVSPTLYWERLAILGGLPGGDFAHMSWWGTSPYRNDNDLPVNAAIAMVPDGTRLLVPPPGTYPITAPLFCNRNNLKIEGRGRATRFLTLPINNGDYNGAYNGIVVNGDNLEIDGLFIRGIPSNKTSGNAYGIVITGESLLDGDQSTTITMRNCIYENFSVGGVVYAHPGAARRATRSRKIRIFNNEFTCNVQGFALFGCEDVWFTDNIIEWFEGVAVNNLTNTVMYGLRVLGAVRCRISGNTVIGGLKGANRPGYAGITISNGALGGPPIGGPENGNIVACRDLRVHDNDFIDFYEGLNISACRGTSKITRNKFTCGNLTNTAANSLAIGLQGDGGYSNGTYALVDDTDIDDNRFEGFTIGYMCQSGIARVQLRRNTLVANGHVESCMINCVSGLVAQIFDIIGNSFIGYVIAGRIVAGSGQTVTIADNRFGEEATNANVAVPFATAPIGMEGTGSFFCYGNRRAPFGTRNALVNAYNFQTET
jgi:hypothetical protein